MQVVSLRCMHVLCTDRGGAFWANELGGVAYGHWPTGVCEADGTTGHGVLESTSFNIYAVS